MRRLPLRELVDRRVLRASLDQLLKIGFDCGGSGARIQRDGFHDRRHTNVRVLPWSSLHSRWSPRADS